MYKNINEELQKAQEGMLYHQRLLSMLEDVRAQRDYLVSKTEELKAQLKKEDMDVEKLERKSLSHILYSVIGNLDKILDKERQEALAARLKYEQACIDLKDVEEELARLEAEVSNNREWEEIYQRLYNEKKEQLIASGSRIGEEILTCYYRFSLSKINRYLLSTDYRNCCRLRAFVVLSRHSFCISYNKTTCYAGEFPNSFSFK